MPLLSPVTGFNNQTGVLMFLTKEEESSGLVGTPKPIPARGRKCVDRRSGIGMGVGSKFIFHVHPQNCPPRLGKPILPYRVFESAEINIYECSGGIGGPYRDVGLGDFDFDLRFIQGPLLLRIPLIRCIAAVPAAFGKCRSASPANPLALVQPTALALTPAGAIPPTAPIQAHALGQIPALTGASSTPTAPVQALPPGQALAPSATLPTITPVVAPSLGEGLTAVQASTSPEDIIAEAQGPAPAPHSEIEEVDINGTED